MPTLGRLVVVLAVAAWATTPAGAQLMLAGQASVQKELKLTEDQVSKVKELDAKARASRQGLVKRNQKERQQSDQELAKANEKALAGMLTPEQSKRLRQIAVQVKGALFVLHRPNNTAETEVAQAVGLTDEQRQRISAVWEDFQASSKQLLRAGAGGGNIIFATPEAIKKVQALSSKFDAEVVALLTDEQKRKWKDLIGEPFKGTIVTPFGRGQRDNNK
jgi:hypothetical protein